MVKRIVDVVGASVVGVVAAPLLALLMILIKLTSPGPALFVQPRVGRGGTVFNCYKLRTMSSGTASVLSHLVASNSVTPLGKMLRYSKLDELPQLFNVLIGDMSLVGPRPGLTTDDKLFELRNRQGVFLVRPGITGLAQVHHIDMSTPDRLALIDAAYVHHQSLRLDIELIAATFCETLRPDDLLVFNSGKESNEALRLVAPP